MNVRIGNNYMVNTKSIGGVWHQEYFIAKSAARAYANDAYRTGSVIVELYSRARVGWNLIKKSEVSTESAILRREMHIKSLLPEDCIIIHK